MSRKDASFRQLIDYMKKDRGEVVFGHNLCANPFGRQEDIILEFEANARRLRERKNGNVLYHEVISLEAGTELRKEEIIRILGEIGREYVSRRSPHQMSLGIAHTDAKHIHLHICMSANSVGTNKRERLSKEQFSGIQKEVEKLVCERWQELSQTNIYTKERGRERLKTTTAEQEMHQRTGEPSRKEEIKTKLHGILQRAGTPEELTMLLREHNLELYQRGKTIGVIDQETGRKHRLSTLGVEAHYEASMVRIFSGGKESLETKREQQAQLPPKQEVKREVPHQGKEQEKERHDQETQGQNTPEYNPQRTVRSGERERFASPHHERDHEKTSTQQPPQEKTPQHHEPTHELPRNEPRHEHTRSASDEPSNRVHTVSKAEEDRRREELDEIFQAREKNRDHERNRGRER